MPLGGDQHQRVGQKAPRQGVLTGGRVAEEVQVVGAIVVALQHMPSVAHMEADLHLGKALTERPEQPRQNVLGGGNHADTEAAADPGAGIPDAIGKILEAPENIAGGAEQLLPHEGGLEAAITVFQQFRSHCLGKALQLLGNGGLGEVQFRRRPGHGSGTHHGHIHLQQAEGQMTDIH